MRIENLATLIGMMAAHAVPADITLFLDNDGSSLVSASEEDMEFTWDIHPEVLLEQALDLLGIRHEHV